MIIGIFNLTHRKTHTPTTNQTARKKLETKLKKKFTMHSGPFCQNHTTTTTSNNNTRRSARTTKTHAAINESQQHRRHRNFGVCGGYFWRKDNQPQPPKLRRMLSCNIRSICNITPSPLMFCLVHKSVEKVVQAERYNPEAWDELDGCRKGKQAFDGNHDDSYCDKTGGILCWSS